MAWVAFDRGVQAVHAFGLQGDADRWAQLRDKVHDQVCRLGFDRNLNSFVQYYGSREPDASLLMLPLVGFLKPDDPRIQGTIALIEQHLTRDGFVQRYRCDEAVENLPPGEGAFFLCTFWMIDNLALQGRQREARQTFERLLSLQNDVGLLSEEYDVVNGRLLGNFPQAFSHLALVNTARHLTRSGGPSDERRTKSNRKH